MDLNRLTHDADDLIRKVVSRYNQLYVPAGTISQLELDLILDDLRKLYDTFKNIGHLNLTLQDTVAKPEVRVNTAIPAHSQPATQTPPTYYSKEHFNAPEPTPEQHKSKPETEPVMEKGLDYVAEQEPLVENEILLPDKNESEEALPPGNNTEPPPIYERKLQQPLSDNAEKEYFDQDSTQNKIHGNQGQAPELLADKFNTGNKSLSETMAMAQAPGGIGSRLLLQPIADLHAGIGLNDKFSFISDLFSNSPELYAEAITRINRAVNIDEANWILQKYETEAWNQNPESLQRLRDFVKRRFI